MPDRVCCVGCEHFDWWKGTLTQTKYVRCDLALFPSLLGRYCTVKNMAKVFKTGSACRRRRAAPEQLKERATA